MKVKLVALVSGQRKDGTGTWFRATLKGHNKEGKPVINALYIDQAVGEKAVREGIIEDCDVNINFDFDDYMRPTISEITKAAVSSKGQVTV